MKQPAGDRVITCTSPTGAPSPGDGVRHGAYTRTVFDYPARTPRVACTVPGTSAPMTPGRTALIAGAAALIAAGCTIGPRYVPPGAPATQRYTGGAQPRHTVAGAAGTAQHFVYGKKLNAQWWTLFRSTELDRLLRTTLRRNPTLEAARATLRQAQATLEADEGMFYPQVSGQLGAKRQRFSGAVFGGGLPSRIFNLYTGGLNVSYYPDFFGANRLVYHQQKAHVDYRRFQMQAAYLTLESNVVSLAITTAELREQIRATHTILADERTLLTLTGQRYRLGAVPYLDVVNQRSRLAVTRAGLPPLEQQLARTRHRLAILSGEYPSQWKGYAWTLAGLRLPRELPVSLPSALVQQRPDIRAAEAQMRAANAQVGIDTARMYPVVSLTASFGQQGALPRKLFDSAGNVWGLAADLTQPLFQGGLLRAQRRASREAYRAMAADYRKTVLGAFAQVADALRAVENGARTLRAQQQALDAAREALGLARSQYAAGAVDYLRVLDAQITFRNARIRTLQARAGRLRDTTALFAAIGGGWWPQQPGGAKASAGVGHGDHSGPIPPASETAANKRGTP